jgi:peptide/nickel transport system permease protein
VTAATAATPGRPSSRVLHAFLRNPLAIGGLGLFGLTLLAALFAPALAPDAYDDQNVMGRLKPPLSSGPAGRVYLLGTDQLGRDMLSRILFGARFTIGLALVAALAASITGTTLALVSATAGGWTDEAMSRVMDALISIPSKMLALVMVAAFGSSVGLLILTAAVSYTPGAFRIARSLAVNVRTLEYVLAARARGERLPYVALVEILPNMVNPMLADFGLRFVFVVLLLSGMSFLGLGVQPPDADLGSLVRENISGLFEGAPAVVMPAIAIATLTVSVNLLIDGISGRTRTVEA